MQPPSLPDNEAERLAALRELEVLDTAHEVAYDSLVRHAARVCGTEIALVSLVDAHRQWFKARVGLDVCETGRDVSFCGHAILQDELFVVPDTRLDARFGDNPLVTGPPHIRFYAGAQIRDAAGFALGTVCVISSQPRRLDAMQEASLRHVADHVALLLAMRKASRNIDDYRASLERHRWEREEERRLVIELMKRMMRPDRLDASALDYCLEPADHLGGDLLAAARSRHGKYYVLLADSTGHGLPAAVNLLPINRIFYTMVAKNLPVGLIVEEMNRCIREQAPVGRFVAATLLCLDPADKSAEVWNGGMPLVLFMDADGNIRRRFESENFPFGIADTGEPPRIEVHRWESPGQFFACSDGLVEACAPDGRFFGAAAIEALLARTSAAERLERLRQAMRDHLAGVPRQDDMTAALIDTVRL